MKQRIGIFNMLFLLCLTSIGLANPIQEIEWRVDSLRTVAESLDQYRVKVIYQVNRLDPYIRITQSTSLVEAAPPKNGMVLAKLNVGDSAYLYDDETTDFFKVEFRGIKGYVPKKSAEVENVKTIDSLQAEFSKNEAKLDSIRDKIPFLERESLVRKLRAKYKKKFVDLILAHEIKIGMSREMVVDSWGEPKSRNKSVGSWGVHEQWIYDDTYLYFENGQLKSYQTSE